tara:strand:- start:135 stop:452 length:318 start_codon:yes stop_codon:yes gene_type:complete
MKKIHRLYNFYLILSYFLYGGILFGVSFVSETYLNTLNSIVKVLISLMLIYVFNPFKKKSKLTSFEKDIIFSAGVYLLLTTFIGEYLVTYGKNLENVIKKEFVFD